MAASRSAARICFKFLFRRLAFFPVAELLKGLGVSTKLRSSASLGPAATGVDVLYKCLIQLLGVFACIYAYSHCIKSPMMAACCACMPKPSFP